MNIPTRTIELPATRQRLSRPEPGRVAAIAALGYLVAGVAWVAFSDRVGALLFTEPAHLTRYQTYKGAFFVAATALALFVLLWRALAAPAASASRDALASRANTRPWPIGALLLALALSTGLPLIALVGLGIQREAARGVEEANRRVDAVTVDAAADAARLVASVDRIAALLRQRLPAHEALPAQCDGLAGDIMAARAELANLRTLDAQGRVLCAAASDGPAPPAVQPYPPGVGRIVGHPWRDARTGAWLIAFTYPLRDADMPRGAIEISVAAAALRPAVARALPEGGATALIDEDRWYIARSPGGDLRVGTRLEEGERTRLAAIQRIGTMRTTGPDGVERLYAYRPVAGTPWFAVSGVPVSSLYANARHDVLVYGAAGLVALALAAALATVLARRIGEPMHALARTVARIGRGELDVRASVDGPAEVAQVAATFNDMLERLPAIEQELSELLARNTSLVELAPDGILVQDGRTPVYANAGLRRLFGLPEGFDLVHLSLVDLTVPAQRERMAARMARLEVDPGTTSIAEFAMLRADGTVIEVEHSASSVLMHGHAIAVQSYLRDVTARNRRRDELTAAQSRLEQAVRDRTAELQASNEALASFSRSVAHDLRAPLATVGGFVHLLQRALQGGDTARAASHAERVREKVRTMGAMIDGLMKLARNDGAPLSREPVDMRRLAQEALEEHGAAERADVVFEGECASVPGDANLLRQVWCNLVSNALKFGSTAAEPRITLGCRAEDGGHTFFVGDNGCGFDPARAAGLFEPFVRLDSARQTEGTGIGLTIARRVVQRHGGRIWAESSPGEGARFHFWLPD